jgi:U3 small nucleolar RNA-associated protein 5
VAVAWAETVGALYTAGADRRVVRLDPGNGSVVSRFEAGQHPLAALAVTPDGRRAFAASTAVTAWDPAEQRRLFKYTGHPVRRL